MAANRRTPAVENEDLALILGKYALGELTLGQAAAQTGVSRWTMKEILTEAGIALRLGPTDEDNARLEVETALQLDATSGI